MEENKTVDIREYPAGFEEVAEKITFLETPEEKKANLIAFVGQALTM